MPLYHSGYSTLVFFAQPADPKHLLSGKINVFVCGALQNPDKMNSVINRAAPFTPAAVGGFKRITESIDDAAIPFMVPSENLDEILTGILWLDLSEQELSKIEGLELNGDFRKRIEIEVCVGQARLPAFTYVKK